MDLQDAIVDDRERGLFRVKRETMTRDDVWALERERIFDTCWLYVGHDSEIDAPGFNTEGDRLVAEGGDYRIALKLIVLSAEALPPHGTLSIIL
jgi:hypothetical protein